MLSLSVTLIQIDCFESDASVVCVCVWGGGGGGGQRQLVNCMLSLIVHGIYTCKLTPLSAI